MAEGTNEQTNVEACVCCIHLSSQEDRYAQIERDNRLLLEKMSHIMRKGSIDNQNNTSKYAKSLNKEARKRELCKITRENQVCIVRSMLSPPVGLDVGSLTCSLLHNH